MDCDRFKVFLAIDTYPLNYYVYDERNNNNNNSKQIHTMHLCERGMTESETETIFFIIGLMHLANKLHEYFLDVFFLQIFSIRSFVLIFCVFHRPFHFAIFFFCSERVCCLWILSLLMLILLLLSAQARCCTVHICIKHQASYTISPSNLCAKYSKCHEIDVLNGRFFARFCCGFHSHLKLFSHLIIFK